MPHDLAIVLKAACFAADRHRDQRRKDVEARPYINHPLEVARILAEEGGVTDPVLLAAAILHDTIEDTLTTPEQLVDAFGPEVAGIVVEVTDDKSLEKADRKRLQIESAPAKSTAAAMLKIADKIANLQDLITCPPADWGPARKLEYAAWATQVVEALPPTNDRLLAKFAATVARCRVAANAST